MTQTNSFFDKHITTLRQAIAAAETRTSWSLHPESLAALGEFEREAGRNAFEAYRGASFYLDQPGVIGRVGNEQSPYGLSLNISYPQCSADALIMAAKSGMQPWIDAGPDVRTGVCLEILDRLHLHGIEIAYAVMHTTGQPLGLAYQYSMVKAADRGLEATAAAYREMKQVPDRALWEKRQGNTKTIRIEKTYTIAPRGIALVISSATEPTSNSWPGLFASLVTGNSVIVHAHSAAVLPLAITVALARQVIKEAGFDPNLISLLVDAVGTPSATVVGLRPEIRIIDCSGEADTANWLEQNAQQAAVFSLKTGANCVVVDSVGNYNGMLHNLALSLCLNSGQLAASPRLVMVSREGVRTETGPVSADKFCHDLATAMGQLIENADYAMEVLGAIQSPSMLKKVQAMRDVAEAEGDFRLLRDLVRLEHPQWPTALVVAPLLLKQELDEFNRFLDRVRGPVAFVAEVMTTAEALSAAERIMRDKGALNFSIFTDSAPIQQMAQGLAARVGVALNINFTGNVLLSETEAFTDFYATGENSSATCSLIDAAYVARRFFVFQTRRQL